MYILYLLQLKIFVIEWQWRALHKGRLTTSKAAVILGLYESKSSTFLKIPKSLTSH
jgi:hypothetical protein